MIKGIMKVLIRIIAFNLVLLNLLPVIAQDLTLPPYNDSIDLDAGFDDDPHFLEVTAGGSQDASELGNNCVGFVSDKPDFSVNYTSGEYDLNFGAASFNDMDTTLVINDPNGSWICNDDFGESTGTNPGISFSTPDDGKYDIWVGVYSSDDFSGSGGGVVLFVTERDLGEVYEMVADVLSESDDGVSSSYGTGFVVSESGHILTNHHVVEECSEITFQIRGSETREVALLSTNAPSDLALLKIESFDGDPAGFLSSSIARMGEELVVYGFPLAGDLSAQGNFTNGIVSAMSGLNDDLTKFQMTAPIQPGNSGGPVLSLSGQIIGIVVETANHEMLASITMDRNVYLQSVLPHMHFRGKRMRFTAEYPDGTEEVLFSQPHYNFNWQLTYFFEEPVFLPEGTSIVLDGAFDNSAQNPFNPDPSITVRDGQQSWEEMFFGFMTWKDADQSKWAIEN